MAFIPPNASSYPSTFNPVMTQDYLNSLYSGINQQEEQDIGGAEGNAISRGISNSPIEAGNIGAATQNADTARNQALQGFLYNLSGQKENENTIGNEQAYGASEQSATEAWQGGQNNLDRALQEKLGLAKLSEQTALQNQKDLYGLYGSAFGGGTAALGAVAAFA